MARRRRRKTTQREDLPGWAWMLFGLAIGLAVAFAVFVNSRDTGVTTARTPAPRPAAVATAASSNLDNNGERTGSAEPEVPESRFDFYKMLPSYEVIIHEEETNVARDVAPQAIVDPGEYVLQAGSFTRYEDADRRRAQLALQGIESSIQRVTVNDKTYHRVRIGPTRDLGKLNQLRARLREANIDVLRIRLGD